MLALPSETAVFLWPSKHTWSVGSITFSSKLKPRGWKQGVNCPVFWTFIMTAIYKIEIVTAWMWPLNLEQWRQLVWIFPLTICFGFCLSFAPFYSPETRSSSCHWTTTPPYSLCHRLGWRDSLRWCSHWTERLGTPTPSRYCTTKQSKKIFR